MIKVEKQRVCEAVENCIKKAAKMWRGMEVQLYGRTDGKEILYFFYQEFVGHNSWLEGSDIIHIWTQKAFDPLEPWNYAENLCHELNGDDELLMKFRAMTTENEIDLPEYPISEWWIEAGDLWEIFAELMPDDAERLLEEWRGIAINELIMELDYDWIVEQLLNDGRLEMTN